MENISIWWYVLGGWVLLANLVLFCVMGIDKGLAKKNARRVPEKTLFLIAAFGGALGGILGMSAFRHKTQHKSFLIGFPLLLVLNVAIAGAFVYLLVKA